MMKKIFDELENTYLGLSILALMHIVAGLSLLIQPENVSHIVIMGVGLIWFLKGIRYCAEMWNKDNGNVD